MGSCLAACALLVTHVASAQNEPTPSRGVTVTNDGEANTLTFAIAGREAFVYQYASHFAIPHIWPLRAPSGNSLTVQKTEPFPHHRSLWIVDKVRLSDGPVTDFYHEWKNLKDAKHPEKGHASFIRHERLDLPEAEPATRAEATAHLTWFVGETTPVLDQSWTFQLEDLGEGEFLLELSWELRAAYGDVQFLSDWVHYAWPYVRMEPRYSGEQGGALLDDQGRRGQKETNGQYAHWIDYWNTVDGKTEGLAVFVPRDGAKRKWLTREYGTFGPRRADAFSGTNFTLKRDGTLTGRAAILVHRGDAKSGRVAERYEEWVTRTK